VTLSWRVEHERTTPPLAINAQHVAHSMASNQAKIMAMFIYVSVFGFFDKPAHASTLGAFSTVSRMLAMRHFFCFVSPRRL
jgi:hypothetical protein